MNSFVFLAPIAGLFGIIALTSLLSSIRSDRFSNPDRAPERVKVKSRIG